MVTAKPSSAARLPSRLAYSLEDVSGSLGTSVEVVEHLIRMGKIRTARVGSRTVVLRADLEDALQRRDELIGDILPGSPSDWRFQAFEDGAIFANTIGKFFHVDTEEVRRVLEHFGPRNSISKATLWALIVAGSEKSSGALTAIEKRLDKTRRLRIHRVTPRMRDVIYERDQRRCRYCGRRIDSDAIQLDHVIPQSRGGGRERTNLVLTCSPCNAYKGKRLPHEAGMILLPIGTLWRGRKRPRYRLVIPPPETPYSLLVEPMQ